MAVHAAVDRYNELCDGRSYGVPPRPFGCQARLSLLGHWKSRNAQLKKYVSLPAWLWCSLPDNHLVITWIEITCSVKLIAHHLAASEIGMCDKLKVNFERYK